MPYLQRRSIAFGTYIAPRQAPQRRRQVNFAGHYGMQWIGLGSLGDADWSGFLTTIQNALRAYPLIAGTVAVALRAVFGSTNPSASQINASNANQFILALGGGPGSLTAGNPAMRLTGAAGAARDALYSQLVAYTANPPQLPAPAPAPPAVPIVSPTPTPIGAPVPASYYAGTPVPVGYPITQIFVEPNGNQWMFDQASQTWKNATAAAIAAATASESAQAAQIAAATATSPGGPESPTLVTSPTVSPYLPNQPSLSPVSVSVSSPGSGYSDILNWLGESTLISPVPNWVLLAGAGLVAIKLSGKGHLL
jgi:hypothetical protein